MYKITSSASSSETVRFVRPRQIPNLRPSISAYYQTRSEHHAVVTSEWLAPGVVGRCAIRSTAVAPSRRAAHGGRWQGRGFSVINEFAIFLEEEADLAEVVAAIMGACGGGFGRVRATDRHDGARRIELKKASTCANSLDTFTKASYQKCKVFCCVDFIVYIDHASLSVCFQTSDLNKALSPNWNMCKCNTNADVALQADNSKLAYYALEFLYRWFLNLGPSMPQIGLLCISNQVAL
ncbi:uncharacterized protein A4U43_C06F19910 [Asparagus officinalis]|uniref:Uncharacterized protein n=1 Tax=Asparagus officinalis TaxID=4686 RepID=A0A5P1EQK9_ASPOF|nr:uncharacterized protein A4U43_C06F19910 [Asparagus officinalis]